jgi:hypothetical protein
MRRTIPLIVLVLALLALAACSAADVPAPQEPSAPTAAPEAPAAPEAQLPAEFVGVYTASLPAADTPGREITVDLQADGAVTVTSDYLNGQPPIVETGAWSGNPSGAVTVVLTEQDGQAYFEPRSFLVGLEGDELLVLGEGGQVARFARGGAEPAAAAPSGETAPAATEVVTSTAAVTTTQAPPPAVVVTATQPITATAVPTATAVMTDEANLANTYLGLLPAASGGGTRLMALSLFADGIAQWATEFASEETPIVEQGVWVDNGDETITVTLTGRADLVYDAPVVVTFQRDGDLLQSVDAEDLFGSEGVRLRLAADVARDVDASLIAIDLEAGFPLDPTFVSVQGGGEVDASLLSGECVGFVNRQPVVTVNWTGAAPFVETFFVSDSDPTLMVLTPDGRLLCNDDANEDLLDPVIEISEPVTGTYRIWVGSYAKGQLIPGVLVLTTNPEVNIGTFNLGGLIRRPLVAEIQPEPKLASTSEAATASIQALASEAVTLAPDSEPLSASLTVSGTIPLFELDLPDPACNGLVSGVPDFVFNWTGDGEAFSVFFEGDGDSTLLVLSEDTELLACGDDAEFDANINPLVTVADAKPGLYGVWVGRLDPTKPVLGTLTVTTAADAAPKVLGPVQ